MTQKFEGFAHKANELSAYTYSVNIFVISLKNGSVIHYETLNPDAFLAWLKHHKIRDVRDELPKHIREALFKAKN